MPEWFCLIYSTPVFSSFSPNTKEHPLNSLGFTRSCLSICCFSPHFLSFPGDSVGILLPMQETQETWVSSLVFPPGKIPWRRAWWPTPVFLPEKSYRQRSLAGYGPWVAESQTEWLSTLHLHSTHLLASFLEDTAHRWAWGIHPYLSSSSFIFPKTFTPTLPSALYPFLFPTLVPSFSYYPQLEWCQVCTY